MDLCIQADAILVSSTRLLAPGQIRIRHGRVLEVSSHVDSKADINLEGSVLLPGLVNPHTHLEFSDLDQPLPAGENFPAWIASVLAFRQNRSGAALSKPQAIQRGLAESQTCGIAAIADIVTFPWLPSDFSVQPTHTGQINDSVRSFSAEQSQLLQTHLPDRLPQVIACLEQLGVSAERSGQMIAWRDEVLAQPTGTWPAWLRQLAFSPHAPYSTPLALCQLTTQQAARRRALVAMHLAESPAERQWLDSGTGPMAEMLLRFGNSSQPPSRLIQDLIDALAVAPRGLVIHGNYLNPIEMEHLSTYRDRLCVVYCPRTHQHFGHMPYPLDALRALGITVVLGTDSRSTNPDLNIRSEACTALNLHRSLRPTEALAAITSEAAMALAIDDDFGSLEPGRLARINSVTAPNSWKNAEELVERMLHADNCDWRTL